MPGVASSLESPAAARWGGMLYERRGWYAMKYKHLLFVLMIWGIAGLGCGFPSFVAQVPEATPVPVKTLRPTFTVMPTATETLPPTPTPAPTDTPVPTPTPFPPTNTPVPPTPTPVPPTQAPPTDTPEPPTPTPSAAHGDQGPGTAYQSAAYAGSQTPSQARCWLARCLRVGGGP